MFVLALISFLLLALAILSIKSSKWEVVGVTVLVLLAVMFSTFFVSAPIVHLETKAFIAEYRAFVYTLENIQKEGLSESERLALIQELLEINKTISRKQYWNGTVLDAHIPDEIMQLEMISIN